MRRVLTTTIAAAAVAALIFGVGPAIAGETCDPKVDQTCDPAPEPTPTVTSTPTATPTKEGPPTPTSQPTVTVTVTPPPEYTPPYVPPPVPAPDLIHVADLTNGRWPVAEAVRNWNKNGRLKLVMVPACYNPDVLPDGVPCVDVVQGHDPAGHGGWLDVIIPHQRYQVFLNIDFFPYGHGNRRSGIRHERRASVCHELGHIWFGMQHFEEGTGCMDLDLLEERRYASPALLRRLRETRYSAL